MPFMRLDAERAGFVYANQPTELVQTSARKILATSGDVPTKTTAFRKYAKVTIQNAARDWMRREKVRGGHESKAALMRDYCVQYANMAFQGRYDPEEVEEAIQLTLEQNPHLKEAFEPLIYRNFTDKQVAAEIGITDSAVRSRWEQARKLVKQRLTERAE